MAELLHNSLIDTGHQLISHNPLYIVVKSHFSTWVWAVSEPFLLAAFLHFALFTGHNLTDAGTQGLLP